MALGTIRSLSESYTTGTTLQDIPSFMDSKDDEDIKNEDYSYQPDQETRATRQLQLDKVKEEGSEEEDSDDSDELLEVIG
jgi:hypothetical protein